MIPVKTKLMIPVKTKTKTITKTTEIGIKMRGVKIAEEDMLKRINDSPSM